ncbi:MAG TPA: Gmad2 immunoglobulin-like domain-containing protein [Candidatus Polarisedimenticolia bacterium]|nr:Gmad2 immunoglobulin-like domain-containing protein [Candidatus Polarisedimenticolia bacterium]
MRIAALLLACVFLATACVDNRIVVTTPTPSPVVATTAPPATASPSPTPSPTPTPTPVPTPLLSARGGILVKEPLANTKVRSPLTISGDASVFEAALIWQVTDTAGRVLASGFTTATAGAPAKGTFSITATFQDPASDIIGFAEVFTRSPKDGEIDEIVRVPLILAAAR